MNHTPRHQRPSRFPEFLFGVPYYPEHWNEEERQRDPQRMAAAGVNVVRMAEFAWDLMEPRRAEFDFSLFDTAIERLAAHGIRTMLCTPTAAPPAWLTADHPEWMREDANGRRCTHGSRQQCCLNHHEFQKESVRITRAMAEHYANNPQVIGWQTDNEFYCHFSECHCPACVTAFRGWLQAKYGRIEVLNEAWGTRFWAQTYDTFEQIGTPLPDRPTFPNPGQHLDYFRFLSDSATAFQRQQVEVLRAAQARWWITHNGVFQHIDHWKFAQDLDFYGVDIYPGFAQGQPDDFSWASLKAQECRAASGSFVVPEMQAGAGGQRPYIHKTPQPGQMRLWAYQIIAHGADGILHFRWRTARFGAEIYWNGILDHDDVPRRRYEEFSQEGAELKRIGDRLLGTVQQVEAAVLVQQDQEEAHGTMSMNLPSPACQRRAIFHEMLRRHLRCGLVDASDSFAGLRLIVMPGFLLMDEVLAGRLDAFVREGGTLVCTARTATRNRDNQVLAQTPPGPLSGLFGVQVEEFGRLESPLVALKTADREIDAGHAYEVLQPRGAEVIATWSDTVDGSPHAAPGTAAITRQRLGAGTAIYVGTFFTADNTAALLDLVAADCKPIAQADPFVEMTTRHAEGRQLTFLLNHYGQEKPATGLPIGTELLSGSTCSGDLKLPAFGVAIVEHSSGTD